jgi:hypothetical protein
MRNWIEFLFIFILSYMQNNIEQIWFIDMFNLKLFLKIFQSLEFHLALSNTSIGCLFLLPLLYDLISFTSAQSCNSKNNLQSSI